MKLKILIAIGLVAGVVACTVLVWKKTSTKDSQLVQLEKRELEADRLLEADESDLGLLQLERTYLALVADATRLLGPEALQTLHVRKQLISVYRKQRRDGEAIAEYRDLVEEMDRILGRGDARTIETRDEFMVLLSDNERPAEAEQQARILLEESEKSHGRLAWETMGPRHDVIGCLEMQDKFDEMLELTKVDLEIVSVLAKEQRARLGDAPMPAPSDPKAPFIPDYRSQEAIVQKRIALAEQERAVKKQWEEAKAKLGKDHPDAKALEQKLQDLKDESL